LPELDQKHRLSWPHAEAIGCALSFAEVERQKTLVAGGNCLVTRRPDAICGCVDQLDSQKNVVLGGGNEVL
jgi:hypothetical protein